MPDVSETSLKTEQVEEMEMCLDASVRTTMDAGRMDHVEGGEGQPRNKSVSSVTSLLLQCTVPSANQLWYCVITVPQCCMNETGDEIITYKVHLHKHHHNHHDIITITIIIITITTGNTITITIIMTSSLSSSSSSPSPSSSSPS